MIDKESEPNEYTLTDTSAFEFEFVLVLDALCCVRMSFSGRTIKAYYKVSKSSY